MGLKFNGNAENIKIDKSQGVILLNDTTINGNLTSNRLICDMQENSHIQNVNSAASIDITTLPFYYGPSQNWLELPSLSLTHLQNYKIDVTKKINVGCEVFYCENLASNYFYLIIGKTLDGVILSGLFYYDDYIENGADNNPLRVFSIPTVINPASERGIIVVGRGQLQWTPEFTWQEGKIYFWFTGNTDHIDYNSYDMSEVQVYKIPLQLKLTGWANLHP